MKKVILFSRVSTVSQSFEEQTKELILEAKKNGYQEDELIIIESKESAIKYNSIERESIQKLYNTIEENKSVECIICREISRLARRPDVLFEIRNYLLDRKIQLISCKPYLRLLESDGTMTQSANIMFSLFSAISESEMQIKKQRFQEGKQKAKSEGRFTGGKILYGYKTDSQKHFIIDPEQADIVKRVFNLYLSREYSARQISSLLYNEGTINQVSEKGREKFVLNILKNKSYCGNYLYPSIVSEQEIDEAIMLCSEYQIKPRRTYKENIYLGHKLLVCKSSGHHMMIRKSDCAYIEPVSKFCININMVDSLLLHCANISYKSHFGKDTAYLIKEYKEKLISIEKKIKHFVDEEAKIKNSIEKVEERLIFGKITTAKADELEKKLTEELKKLRVSHSEDLNNKNALLKKLEVIQSDFDRSLDIYSLDDEGKAELVKKEIKNVIVEKKESGKYLLYVVYQNPVVQSEVYTFNSKKHTIYQVTYTGLEEIKFRMIKRFKRIKQSIKIGREVNLTSLPCSFSTPFYSGQFKRICTKTFTTVRTFMAKIRVFVIPCIKPLKSLAQFSI